jgi:hypothetical protein
VTTSAAASERREGPGQGTETSALSIELLIECADEAVAKALNEALMPDNRYFPKDQRFKASKQGPIVRFDVESPRPRPALSTVASIISDARLFGDMWVEAKTRGLGNAAQP